MRPISCVLPAVVLVFASLTCGAADDKSLPDTERLAASRAAWEKARDAAGGSYSYEVLHVTLVSRQTTRIVVRQGKVVERSFERETNAPAAVEPGRPIGSSADAWTETGAEIGAHGDGAAPAQTVDELYDKAARLLAAPKAEFRERSLGIDERGFLHHCFERDVRIADDAPLDGVKPFQITIGTP